MLMGLGGRANAVKFIIRDRGGQFTDVFDTVLTDAGHPGAQAPAAGVPSERYL